MRSKTSRFPAWRLAITDLLITLGVTLSVQALWPVSGALVLSQFGLIGRVLPTYTVVSLVIVLLWMLALWQTGSWRQSQLGTGTTEYNSVALATVFTFVAIALFSYLTKAEIARGYLLLAMPIGLITLLVGRWLWRQVLVRQRAAGRYSESAVIVGSVKSANELATKLVAHNELGLRVVGAFLSQHTVPLSASQQLTLTTGGIPIWGGIDDLIPTIRERRIDGVIICSADELSPSDVRRLGWELLPSQEKLYLAANIVDVAGPRLALKPVAGVPLIEVEQPKLEGFSRFAKRWFDIFGVIVALILAAPIMLICAIAVKLTDRGPVFFTQNRIGYAGAQFRMVKFRTMREGAESLVDHLNEVEHDAAGNTVLFKLKDDPRVTPAGRWMRRFSLDELPQLFNVLAGTMSLVGPRPPLASEVEQYERVVLNRFIVKPGITGLWQVSGRSDLSWEDSVKADLGYVQNWSIMLDIIILWRTVKAVITGKGAY